MKTKLTNYQEILRSCRLGEIGYNGRGTIWVCHVDHDGTLGVMESGDVDFFLDTWDAENCPENLCDVLSWHPWVAVVHCDGVLFVRVEEDIPW